MPRAMVRKTYNQFCGGFSKLFIFDSGWYNIVASGRIENAKFLLSIGAIWHPMTCYAAAIGNHVNFLTWAR